MNEMERWWYNRNMREVWKWETKMRKDDEEFRRRMDEATANLPSTKRAEKKVERDMMREFEKGMVGILKLIGKITK